MQDFRNLKVWQKSHELALMAYKLTADFPREETFGLRHSIRTTAVDIAEGAGKTSDVEFAASVNLALSLAMRLEYFALVAHDLELMDPASYQDFTAALSRSKRCLVGLRKRLPKGLDYEQFLSKLSNGCG